MVLKSIDQLRRGLQETLAAGESVAERLALAEVDAVIQQRVRAIIIPSAVVATLFALIELFAAIIGDPETLRLAVTTVLLAAGLYGSWAVATGLVAALPVLAVWWATRVGPHRLAQLMLYELILRKLRETFTSGDQKPSTAGHIARYALKFSGRPSSWEGLAFQLADRIAPRILRHALIQSVIVLLPLLAAWAYYRLQIFPDIIRAETGLGFWSAFAYPVAAIIDAVAGTDFRSNLLAV